MSFSLFPSFFFFFFLSSARVTEKGEERKKKREGEEEEKKKRKRKIFKWVPFVSQNDAMSYPCGNATSTPHRILNGCDNLRRR